MRSLGKPNLKKYRTKRKLILIHIFFDYSAKQCVIVRTLFFSNLSPKYCFDFWCDLNQQHLLLGIAIKSEWQKVAPLDLIDNMCLDIRIDRSLHSGCIFN